MIAGYSKRGTVLKSYSVRKVETLREEKAKDTSLVEPAFQPCTWEAGTGRSLGLAWLISVNFRTARLWRDWGVDSDNAGAVC